MSRILSMKDGKVLNSNQSKNTSIEATISAYQEDLETLFSQLLFFEIERYRILKVCTRTNLPCDETVTGQYTYDIIGALIGILTIINTISTIDTGKKHKDPTLIFPKVFKLFSPHYYQQDGNIYSKVQKLIEGYSTIGRDGPVDLNGDPTPVTKPNIVALAPIDDPKISDQKQTELDKFFYLLCSCNNQLQLRMIEGMDSADPTQIRYDPDKPLTIIVNINAEHLFGSNEYSLSFTPTTLAKFRSCVQFTIKHDEEDCLMGYINKTSLMIPNWDYVNGYTNNNDNLDVKRLTYTPGLPTLKHIAALYLMALIVFSIHPAKTIETLRKLRAFIKTHLGKFPQMYGMTYLKSLLKSQDHHLSGLIASSLSILPTMEEVEDIERSR